MANNLPVPANTTCDVYHGLNRPPAAPDLAGVSCLVEERAGNIKPSGTLTFDYTHFVFTALATDMRDGDEIYLPDKNGVALSVLYVVRAGFGAVTMRKAYCHRDTPTIWPNANIF